MINDTNLNVTYNSKEKSTLLSMFQVKAVVYVGGSGSWS